MIRVYKVQLAPSTNPFIVKDLEEALLAIRDDLESDYNEDIITIQPLTMTQEEFEKIPEWSGP